MATYQDVWAAGRVTPGYYLVTCVQYSTHVYEQDVRRGG
jgi:hypothetical protein